MCFQWRVRSKITERHVHPSTHMQAVISIVQKTTTTTTQKQESGWYIHRNSSRTDDLYPRITKQITTLEDTTRVHVQQYTQSWAYLTRWRSNSKRFVHSNFFLFYFFIFLFIYLFIYLFILAVWPLPSWKIWVRRWLCNCFKCYVLQLFGDSWMFLLFPWNNIDDCLHVCTCVDLCFVRLGPKPSLESQNLICSR